MSYRDPYVPSPVRGATVEKGGDQWTLILVRELRHPASMVWEALTDPEQLSEWAPFDANRSLATAGPVTLSLVKTPKPQVFESAVKRADPPHLLEYSWGGSDLRWELEPHGTGTRLTLWHNIDNRFITWGAAGWHICFDVLDCLLAGKPIGRLVGAEAMTFEPWQRLIGEYAKLLDLHAPPVPAAVQRN